MDRAPFVYDDYGSYKEFDLAGVTHRMRWIKPGTFMMGSPKNELDRFDGESLHRVTLTKGFWLAETACTQAAWTAVMGKNPSRFKGNDRPVEQVSWNDCQDFLDHANATLEHVNIAIPGGNLKFLRQDMRASCAHLLVAPGGRLRLPTEAEWEYACRAGTRTRFSFGNKITRDQANYGYEYGETVNVKALPCNAWGLYQMHGNIDEWCQDWFCDYPAGAVTDPCNLEAGTSRITRGGSWDVGRLRCRSAYRYAYPIHHCYDHLGFRLAWSAIEKQIS